MNDPLTYVEENLLVFRQLYGPPRRLGFGVTQTRSEVWPESVSFLRGCRQLAVFASHLGSTVSDLTVCAAFKVTVSCGYVGCVLAPCKRPLLQDPAPPKKWCQELQTYNR